MHQLRKKIAKMDTLKFILRLCLTQAHLRQNPPLVGVQDGFAHGNTLWCDFQLLILQDVAQGLKRRIQTCFRNVPMDQWIQV